FSFTMGGGGRTSAGVFKTDGTLVRTLWSGIEYSAGIHKFKWDGKDDFGLTLPDEKYTAKVLSNNVQYTWEGVIGNTSAALTGSSKLRMFDPLTGMAVAGDKIYWAAGYNEGWPATYKTSITDPHSKTWIEPMKQSNSVVEFVCTDGSQVFWAGADPFDPEYESFVFATYVSDDSRVPFLNGIPVQMDLGTRYLNAIGYRKTPRTVPSTITGMTVQARGAYLFISRRGLNELQVLNKTTGQVVQTLTMSQPSVMQVDKNDNLWLSHAGKIEKFAVNNTGTLASLGININLANIGAIAVSNDNAVVSANDISSGQVKTYSNLTGQFIWQLGNTKTYIEDATVYDDKFYWKDINKEYHSFLFYMPDGSFYVGDPQNRRVQHFRADRTYIDNIMYQTAMYNTGIDPKDPTRLYADLFEFKLDYTKPLDRSNGSWKLVKNWGAALSNKFDGEKMKCITTFPNGRTYGRLRMQNSYYLAELVEGGALRVIDSPLPQYTTIGNDGSKLINSGPEMGKAGVINRYPVVGYDSNNPVWATTPEVLATTPPATGTDPLLWEGLKSDPITSTNKVIFFDPGKSENGRGLGYHLGAIDKNSNKWLWRTAKDIPSIYTGPFPTDGAFDSGNGVVYAGGTVLISDQNIFWGYHGEFWKGSQTNKWNHVYDNGLFVGQFGEISRDHQNVEAFAGGAGNVFSGSLVKVNGQTYLYHNDESVHGGVHRWKITGLETVGLQDAFPTNEVIPNLEGEDLLKGLVKGATFTSGLGWERTPSLDFKVSDENSFTTKIGSQSYDIFKSPDLFINFRQPTGTADIVRHLGNNTGLLDWKVSGKVNFSWHSPNEPRGYGGGYMEVLDNKGLIIARFYIERDKVLGTNAVGNGTVIHNADAIAFNMVSTKNNQIIISASQGKIIFKYAGFQPITTLPLDATADWQSPAKVRFQFFTKVVADNYDRSIDIAELRFSKTSTSSPIIPIKTSQTIVFSNTLTSVSGNTPVTITAVASSGLPVTHSILSGPGSISGNTLSFTGAGTVVVQASQAGNDAFNPATANISIVNSNVVKTAQTISFTNTPTSASSSTPVALSAVASSGLPVTYSVLSGPGSISGSTLNFTGTGTVVVQANQAGNDAFNPVTATLTIVNSTVLKTAQTISFTNTPTTVSSSTPVTLSAVASSGLAVSYSVLSGPGSVSGNILTFSAAGTVVVQASQAGNITYSAASASLSITRSSKISQTITFTNSNKVYGGAPLTLTAVATSGLPVSFSIISGSGTITNNVLTLKGKGSVTVQATQSGNAMFEPATATMKIDYSSKSSQSIRFASLQNEIYGTTELVLTPIASSGLPVSIEVISGEGYITGNLLTFNGYGSVTVKATQSGNDEIEEVTLTTVITSKPQPGVKVYPNPVIDNNMNVQFNNVPKGVYVARLVNLAGQTVFSTNLSHPGDSANYKISINQAIPPGMCILQISGYELVFKQKILKN
ncbi:MAG TPA: hypothetical protein VGB63_10530, partial [Pedobacter sp.]